MFFGTDKQMSVFKVFLMLNQKLKFNTRTENVIL